ncbi:hypothetical protein OFB74_28480 [Escherichia coli]|nr:hypothetical protein [Escherichia coli]
MAVMQAPEATAETPEQAAPGLTVPAAAMAAALSLTTRQITPCKT